MRSTSRALGTALALAAATFSAPPLGAETGPIDPNQTYRYELGLTGDATLQNPEVRAVLRPMFEEIERSAFEYLTGDRRNRAELDSLTVIAQQVLERLPPSPPDDEMMIQGFETVGRVVSLLELFGRHAQALGLSASLVGKLSALKAANPWNPVLKAMHQGAALKRTLLAGGGAP